VVDVGAVEEVLGLAVDEVVVRFDGWMARGAEVLPAYAELHCRSNFSFLTGASHPEELVAARRRCGYAALAITDECSLAGVVHAHVRGRAKPACR
jgi:hypothetical protein